MSERIYRGTILWNNLSMYARNAVCLQQFKKQIQNDNKIAQSLRFEKEMRLTKNKKEDFHYYLILGFKLTNIILQDANLFKLSSSSFQIAYELYTQNMYYV